jgi:hypothetical protein
MASSTGLGFLRKRRDYLPHIGLMFLAVAAVKIGLTILINSDVVSVESARVMVTVAWLLVSGLGIASYALGRRRKRRTVSQISKPAIEKGPLYGLSD